MVIFINMRKIKLTESQVIEIIKLYTEDLLGSPTISEKLKSLGAVLMNKKSDKTVYVDRKLITGASPLASNELGKLAANTLLKELS